MVSSRSHRRWIGLLLTLFVASFLPGSALAQGGPRPPERQPQLRPVRGVISAVDLPQSRLQLVLFDVTPTTIGVTSQTAIFKGGQRVVLAALAVGDFVEAQVHPRTRVAARVEAVINPPITVNGFLTALDAAAGTLRVTTGHGTSITLRPGPTTAIRFQGRTTTLAGLTVGVAVTARYTLADRALLEVNAQPPRMLIGTLVGIDLTARTLQYQTLAGVTNTVNLTPNSRFRLNGRLVTPQALLPGFEVQIALNFADNTALEVSARTPAILDLVARLTLLDAEAGTVEIGTPYGTAMTLRTTADTTIVLNNATAPLASLAPGDRVQIQYQLALAPGASTALRIIATR